MSSTYSELKVRSHVIGIERLERYRWRVSVDGRRLFTFCSEARARDAGRLEARRLDFVAHDRGAAARSAPPPADAACVAALRRSSQLEHDPSLRSERSAPPPA